MKNKFKYGKLRICFLLGMFATSIAIFQFQARIEATSEVGETVRQYPAPPPAGIYYDYHGASPTNNTNLLDHPLVDGVFVRFGWAQVEPERGKYDFDDIDATIKPWIEAKKGVIIGIVLVGQHDRDTPNWVYDVVKPITYERVISRGPYNVTVPMGWDPTNLPLLEGLVEAFGKKYNGNPNINAVLAGRS